MEVQCTIVPRFDYFRTRIGEIYRVLSHDTGITWSDSAPLGDPALPNPNAKVLPRPWFRECLDHTRFIVSRQLLLLDVHINFGLFKHEGDSGFVLSAHKGYIHFVYLISRPRFCNAANIQFFFF